MPASQSSPLAAGGKLPLRIALGNYGHTAALKNGSIPIEGMAADFVKVGNVISAFRRMVRDLEFDACEMAPTTYFIARAGGAPFIALPTFIMRRFHHGFIACRADAGIAGPKDLEGRRVGVRAYTVTTGVWMRGILASEYGVDLSKVTWVVDDEEHVTTLRLPSNVQRAPDGKSLAGMMAAGELDAAFTGPAGIGRAGPPVSSWEQGAAVRPTTYPPLFPDAAERDAAWFRKTRIYPIHGLVVIKESVLADNPWLAQALYAGFVEAKRRYVERLHAGVGDGADDRHYRELSRVVGDPLPYGIAENRPAIDALIDYTVEQGLMPARLPIGRLFVDPTMKP